MKKPGKIQHIFNSYYGGCSASQRCRHSLACRRNRQACHILRNIGGGCDYFGTLLLSRFR